MRSRTRERQTTNFIQYAQLRWQPVSRSFDRNWPRYIGTRTHTHSHTLFSNLLGAHMDSILNVQLFVFNSRARCQLCAAMLLLLPSPATSKPNEMVKNGVSKHCKHTALPVGCGAHTEFIVRTTIKTFNNLFTFYRNFTDAERRLSDCNDHDHDDDGGDEINIHLVANQYHCTRHAFVTLFVSSRDRDRERDRERREKNDGSVSVHCPCARLNEILFNFINSLFSLVPRLVSFHSSRVHFVPSARFRYVFSHKIIIIIIGSI